MKAGPISFPGRLRLPNTESCPIDPDTIQGISLNSHLIETLSEEAKTPQSGGHARLDALRHCIQQLNDKDRKLIQNRFEKRMTAKVLSQQIGVAMNTIYRNESRILALLMNYVSKALGITG